MLLYIHIACIQYIYLHEDPIPCAIFNRYKVITIYNVCMIPQQRLILDQYFNPELKYFKQGARLDTFDVQVLHIIEFAAFLIIPERT